jgi:tRNA pseudouridine55 synthase
LNKLFVAYKPSGMSSNQCLGRLKRKYKTKKAGYSGTLDPFAKGVLIVALGGHTRLFRFLDKTPKRYRATLWLGAHSETLDIEKVEQIDALPELDEAKLREALKSLEGELEYLPPKYSAKKIDGKRAYDLAREGKEVEMRPVTSIIYGTTLLHYRHPFVTFEATVSEGTYIRSLGKLLCERLGLEGGALSALERLSEGQFRYNNEHAVDIRSCLNIPQNRYTGDPENIFYGRPLELGDFEVTETGTYWIDNGDTISVVAIAEDKVKYVLNKVETC